MATSFNMHLINGLTNFPLGMKSINSRMTNCFGLASVMLAASQQHQCQRTKPKSLKLSWPLQSWGSILNLNWSELGNGCTRVNSWSIQIDGVSSNWLIYPVDIESGKRRFVPLFKEVAHGKLSILSCHFKSLLDNISRKPSTHRQK